LFNLISTFSFYEASFAVTGFFSYPSLFHVCLLLSSFCTSLFSFSYDLLLTEFFDVLISPKDTGHLPPSPSFSAMRTLPRCPPPFPSNGLILFLFLPFGPLSPPRIKTPPSNEVTLRTLIFWFLPFLTPHRLSSLPLHGRFYHPSLSFSPPSWSVFPSCPLTFLAIPSFYFPVVTGEGLALSSPFCFSFFVGSSIERVNVFPPLGSSITAVVLFF